MGDTEGISEKTTTIPVYSNYLNKRLKQEGASEQSSSAHSIEMRKNTPREVKMITDRLEPHSIARGYRQLLLIKVLNSEMSRIYKLEVTTGCNHSNRIGGLMRGILWPCQLTVRIDAMCEVARRFRRVFLILKRMEKSSKRQINDLRPQQFTSQYCEVTLRNRQRFRSAMNIKLT